MSPADLCELTSWATAGLIRVPEPCIRLTTTNHTAAAAARRMADDLGDSDRLGFEFPDRLLLRLPLRPDVLPQAAALRGETGGLLAACDPALLLLRQRLLAIHERGAHCVPLLALVDDLAIQAQIAVADQSDQIRPRGKIPEVGGAEEHVQVAERALLVEHPKAGPHHRFVAGQTLGYDGEGFGGPRDAPPGPVERRGRLVEAHFGALEPLLGPGELSQRAALLLLGLDEETAPYSQLPLDPGQRRLGRCGRGMGRRVNCTWDARPRGGRNRAARPAGNRQDDQKRNKDPGVCPHPLPRRLLRRYAPTTAAARGETHTGAPGTCRLFVVPGETPARRRPRRRRRSTRSWPPTSST